MFTDIQALVSDQQDLAKAAAAYLSDKSIDLHAVATDSLGNTPFSDPGKAGNVPFLIQVTEDFDSAGDNTTCKFELVMADDEALTSNLTVIATSATLAQATLVKGYKVPISSVLPEGITKRYLGCRYTIGTATATKGKVTAGIVFDKQSNM